MLNFPSKNILASAMRYLSHSFSGSEGLSLSFDYSGIGRKFSPMFVSSLYKITYDLLNYLTSTTTSNQIRLQLIEEHHGVILLAVTDQDRSQFIQDSPETKGIIKQVESLGGKISIDHSSPKGVAFIFKINDPYGVKGLLSTPKSSGGVFE